MGAKGTVPSHADPQVAQVILGGIAGSTMTVVSIVFAILLMTLTLVSMQFSPRILTGFVRDRVTHGHWRISGTFSYCMAALPAARSFPYPFSPVATVLGAMILAFACVCLLLFFIHHISQAIGVNNIVDRIASETELIIDDLMPRPQRYPRLGGTYPVDPTSWAPALINEVPGYIRYVDRARLVNLTKTHHVQVHVFRRVGQFVPAGVPLLLASKPERLSGEAAERFRAVFDVGATRTLQQDVEFGVLQMVDVALKAISPAVNDPTSAICCIDQLSRVLIRFAAREPVEQFLFDPPGVVRVSIPWISFERLLNSAFDQIRLYAKGDVAVSLRLLRALGDVVSTTLNPDYRKSLGQMTARVLDGCAERLTEQELHELRVRAREVESLAGVHLREVNSAFGSTGET